MKNACRLCQFVSLAFPLISVLAVAAHGDDIVLNGDMVRTLSDSETLAVDNGIQNVYVSDNAKVVIPKRTDGYSTIFGYGEIVFSGNSKLDFVTLDNRVFIGSTLTGMDHVCHLVFKDHAQITASSSAYPLNGIWFSGPKKDTFIHVVYSSDASSVLGASTMVGYSNGTMSRKGNCRFEISNGYLQSGGNFGMTIGCNANTSNGSNVYTTTGVVAVAGGGLASKGNHGGSVEGNKQFYGTIVGRGPTTVGKQVAYGSLEVSGSGAFTNMVGYFAVGIGRAYGRVLQTGGQIASVPSYDRPMLLGFAGGEGEYIVSNGMSYATSDLYVGGATTDQVGSSNYDPYKDNTDDGVDYNLPSAGRLSVVSADRTKPCSFELTRMPNGGEGFITVGANGTGEVEVGEGSIIICRGMTLKANSTLRIDLGESGKYEADNANAGAFLRVKDNAGLGHGVLTVEDGAKLVVDARNYSGEKWLRIVRPNSRVGSFAAEDITVLGDGEIVQDREGYSSDGSIWYRTGRKGLLLLFR